jgi:hypothetical protein
MFLNQGSIETSDKCLTGCSVGTGGNMPHGTLTTRYMIDFLFT